MSSSHSSNSFAKSFLADCCLILKACLNEVIIENYVEWILAIVEELPLMIFLEVLNGAENLLSFLVLFSYLL